MVKKSVPKVCAIFLKRATFEYILNTLKYDWKQNVAFLKIFGICCRPNMLPGPTVCAYPISVMGSAMGQFYYWYGSHYEMGVAHTVGPGIKPQEHCFSTMYINSIFLDCQCIRVNV